MQVLQPDDATEVMAQVRKKQMFEVQDQYDEQQREVFASLSQAILRCTNTTCSCCQHMRQRHNYLHKVACELSKPFPVAQKTIIVQPSSKTTLPRLGSFDVGKLHSKHKMRRRKAN